MTYEIYADDDGVWSIKCLLCGLTSWHPEDVLNLYCGNCHIFHVFHDDLAGNKENE